MKKVVLSLIITIAIISSLSKQAKSQSNHPVFTSLIRQYEQSIDRADTALGAKLWSKADEVLLSIREVPNMDGAVSKTSTKCLQTTL